MAVRPFRFAVNLATTDTVATWQDKCRRAEDLGYDTITVSDYLDRQSPFLALAAAAAATTRPKVGTYVLNGGFYNPALLARDVVAVQQLSGGRLELGIGTGYARADFEAADIPWPSVSARVSHLERVVTDVRKLAGDHAPPVLIGGNGSRVLALAARDADIVSTTGARSRTERGKPEVVDHAALSARMAAVRSAAADRIEDVELNLLVHVVKVTDDADGGLGFLRGYADHVPEADLPKLPTLLSGTPRAIADQLLAAREDLGFSYFTVLEPMMADFAKVISVLS